MIYRKLSNKIDFKPSALGFGLMRLPMLDEKNVDVIETVKIVRYAIDQGVNYLDTAYFYHGGESERVLAEILKDGYRDKVKIADKMPLWQVKEEGDLDKIFNDQLDKLQVKKIDFYLLHALHSKSLDIIKEFNVIDWLKRKKAAGLIDYIGFSFHDTITVWKEIIDFHDWDFCMLQFNLIDVKVQLDETAIDYARKKDIGVIVMEPLRGGQLTASVPKDIMSLWKEMAKLSGFEDKFYPAQFLLNWIWNFENIGFLISGMSSFQQVIENLSFAKHAKINHLTQEQNQLYLRIQKAYLDKIAISCTKCDYCNICPKDIAISNIFDKLNEVKRYENQKNPSFSYNFIPEDRRANKCTGCELCISVCPQKLNIPALLKKCSQIFDFKQNYREVDI